MNFGRIWNSAVPKSSWAPIVSYGRLWNDLFRTFCTFYCSSVCFLTFKMIICSKLLFFDVEQTNHSTKKNLSSDNKSSRYSCLLSLINVNLIQVCLFDKGLQPTVHGRSLQVLGYTSANGAGNFVRINDLLSSEKCKQILIHHPSCPRFFPLHNNTLKHKALNNLYQLICHLH